MNPSWTSGRAMVRVRDQPLPGSREGTVRLDARLLRCKDPDSDPPADDPQPIAQKDLDIDSERPNNAV